VDFVGDLFRQNVKVDMAVSVCFHKVSGLKNELKSGCGVWQEYFDLLVNPSNHSPSLRVLGELHQVLACPSVIPLRIN